MTNIINPQMWSIGVGAGAFSTSFDAGATSNRILHVYIAETAAAGGVTLTYNGVGLTRQTGAGTSSGLWELIAPASGTNTLSITYGANTATHAAWVWCVDGVNQEMPWTVGFAPFFETGWTPFDTSPITADSTQTCVTLQLSDSGDTVTADDGSLTTTSLVYSTKKLWAGYRQGAGAVFTCSWTINGTSTQSAYAIIYRNAGEALSAGWYSIVHNANREAGANTRNLGSENILPLDSAVQFTKVSSNNGTTVMGLTSGGDICTWGTDNDWGMLMDGVAHPFTSAFRDVPTLVTLSGVSNVIDIAMGFVTNLFVKDDGTVWQTGYDITVSGGGAGNLTPVQVSGLSNIVRVEGGDFNLLALDNSGNLYFVGDRNARAEAGDGTVSGVVVTPFHVLSNVIDFSLSELHCLAVLNDGTVKAWGRNTKQCTGQGTAVGNTTTPQTVTAVTNGLECFAGDGPHSIILTSTNQVWHFGDNLNGQRGDGTSDASAHAPSQITMPAGPTWAHLAKNALSFEVYVLTSTGQVYGWGLNAFGAIARNFFADVLSPTQLYPSLLSNVTAMCNVGDDGIIFRIVTARGRAWCCVVGL